MNDKELDYIIIGQCLGCAHAGEYTNIPSGEIACGRCKRNYQMMILLKENGTSSWIDDKKLIDCYISVDMWVELTTKYTENFEFKKQILAIPCVNNLHATRYDTDDTHTLHLYLGEDWIPKETYDVIIRKKVDK